MKRVLSFLLALALTFSMTPNVFATDEPFSEGDYTYTVANGEATVVGYSGAGGNITIPSTLGGYPVTTIERYVFSENESLTSVNTGGSLTTIGFYAFQDCDNLNSVIIGDSVSTIGSYAFQDCDGLTSVAIPDSVTTIDSYAFLNCDKLNTVTIGDGKTTIAVYAFGNCGSLTTVHFGSGLTSIAAFAFFECTGLTDVYYKGTQSQWNAIVDTHCNEGLLNANLHLQESESEFVAEGTCGENLTWTLDKEGMLTISGEGAMDDFESHHTPWSEYNEQIQSVIIDPNVTSIGANAFYFLPYISSVTIPDAVTKIGVSAFESCYGLRSVTVPAGVTEIGRNAFADCICLGGIWVDEDNTVYSSDAKGVLFNKDKTLLIQAPGDLSGTYTIPASVTVIGNFAFEYSYADAVVFPNGLKTIGRNAFNGCNNLTSVVLPNSVTEIGYKSFSNMECLSKLTLSSGLTVIPEAAFYGNACLTSVTIPEGVQTIGPAAFAGCATLAEVNLPVSLKKIETYVFGVPALQNVRYAGTKAQWDAIEIGESNEALLQANIIYYGDHVHSYTKKVTKSTCTAKGYTTYTCVCGDTYKANYTNALGHTYKSGRCTRCNHKPAGAKITTQPVNVAVASGKTAKVTVKATGDGLKYQWYYAKKGSSKFKKISSAKAATYSLKMTSSTNGRKVYCVVTDKYGVSVKSKTVTLKTFDTVKAVSGSWKGVHQEWLDGYKQSISKITIQITSKGKVTLKAPASGTGYNGGTYTYTLKFVKLSGDTATYRFTNKTETLTVTYSISKDQLNIHLGSGYTQVYKPK